VNRKEKNDVIEGWRHWCMLFFSDGSRPRPLYSNTKIKYV